MKRKFLSGLLIALGFGSLFTSCSKEVCYTCTLTFGADTYKGTTCREDFDSEQQFKQYVAEAVASGADCEERKFK